MTYERVTYRPVGERRRTVLLQGVATAGGFLTGIEVDEEGVHVSGRGFDERRRIISLDLVEQRTPMVVSLTYGLLEPAGGST